MAENDALKKQVDELTSELNTNNLERYELENLRELLALDQKYPSYEKVAAMSSARAAGTGFPISRSTREPTTELKST